MNKETKQNKKIEKVIKVVKKTASFDVSEVYKITIIVNGETFKFETNDLEKTFLSFEMPFDIVTDVFITVEKGEEVLERMMTALQAKRIFADEMNIKIFISNVLF